MNQYQSKLEAIVDWHQFIEDVSIQYCIPIHSVYRMVIDVFVMQQQMGVAK